MKDNDTNKPDPHSFIFDGKGGAKVLDNEDPINIEEIPCCFWQQLDYQEPKVRDMLLNNYHLDNTVVDALCDDDARPRFFSHNGGIALIMRGVNLNPNSDPEDMISFRIWLDDRKIITLSHRRFKSINDIIADLFEGRGPKTTADCFLKIAENITDKVAEIVDDISDRTTDLEEKVIDADNLSDFELRSAISELRREIITIRRHAAPQKEIFQNLQNDKSNLLSVKNKAELREIINTLIKTVEDLDYAKDHLSISHEELQSKMSLNMSRIMYMISIVTVIFMPLGLLAGLLGINVAGIPYAESKYAFAFVCGGLVVIGALLITIMKKLRWLQ